MLGAEVLLGAPLAKAGVAREILEVFLQFGGMATSAKAVIAHAAAGPPG